MKTPFNKTMAWMAVVMTALTGGCIEPKNSGADASTNNVPATGATAEAGSGTEAQVGEDGTVPTDPPTLRSERAKRTFPDEVAKVIELVEAGASEEVVRAYASRSTIPYELSLDDVLYLRDIGVPDGVVAAMMRRGAELRQQQAEVAALQTNLVSAVEDIKAALATRNDAPAAATAEGAGPAAPAGTPVADAATAPGPAPLPQATVAVPADAPTEVQPFYESLNPYGSWYQVPSYGWVWQPNVVVVNSGWSPYCQGGRWVWSDWGWYWSSEYSWGWAPFHYGRWCTYPGLGWCWVPGTVWGPSWVTWRSHGTYVGWAPLPPHCGWASGVGLTWYGRGVSVGFGFGLAPSCYTFVSYGNFCHRNVGHHALRRDHATTVYNNSTVVNNVIHGNNNTIVNQGVGYDAVASRTRSEIPKARIEPLPETVDQAVRVDRMERGRDGMVVYRPTPVAEAGGRPTAFRSEARPSSSVAGSASNVPGSPGRGESAVPGRSGYDSRFAGAPGAAAVKPVEARGASGRGGAAGMAVPDANPSRPMAGSVRTPSPARQSAPNTLGAVPKAVEGRGTLPSSRSSVAGSSGQASPGTVLGPTRQTTPVPLSDPSRYLPRSSVPAPRGATPTVSPKSGAETRGGTVAPSSPVAPTAPTMTAPAARGYAPPSRTVTPMPRVATPQAAPKVDYSRSAPGGYSSSPARVPAGVPSAASPRTSYSAPAPSMSVPSAPRPSFSAPSPAMSVPSAPRQTITAPAPSMGAPNGGRPSSASPSPAGASPSGRGGGNNGRNPPN